MVRTYQAFIQSELPTKALIPLLLPEKFISNDSPILSSRDVSHRNSQVPGLWMYILTPCAGVTLLSFSLTWLIVRSRE